jgi:hypothetical protein
MSIYRMMDDFVYHKLLSTWIVLYSIGYVLSNASTASRVFKYNPIILLYIAYLFVILSAVYIISLYNKNTQLFYFLLVNSAIKLPFILLIWNRKITTQDIIFTCVFLLLYVIYMMLINEDIVAYYGGIVKNIINHEDKDGIATPLFTLYKKYIL